MADQWGERMPRSVSLLQTVAVSVGVAIGSGIFRVPATVAAQLHAPGPIIACWVLGGIIALCGALTVAELAAALPRSGGIFAWLLESYGPLAAFLFGWTELVVIRAAALGAIATIFAEYLGYFVPLRWSRWRAARRRGSRRARSSRTGTPPADRSSPGATRRCPRSVAAPPRAPRP